MKHSTTHTTIDNSQRLFILQFQGWSSDKIVCNLSGLPDAVKSLDKNQSYIIFEYWNSKLKRCSKTHLNGMFEANQIDFKIK